MLKRASAVLLSALLPLVSIPSGIAAPVHKRTTHTRAAKPVAPPVETAPVEGGAYLGRPKLVILLVIDQFRADYLQRYRQDFKGEGFRLFLDKGAYFPDCYYDYANTETAPGHSALGTGAYSNGNGINGNQWWNLTRSKTHQVTSVEDERYSLVGVAPSAQAAATPVAVDQEEAGTAAPANAAPAPAATPAQPSTPASAAPPVPGASPRNLIASTVGDELRLATSGASQVWGVSLKDRAAILPAGASANGAFWIDAQSGRFISSTYYMNALPAWAEQFNDGAAIQQAAQAANVPSLTNFYSQVGATNAGNQYELQFAEALIQGEGLGTHPTTDMLTLSLSSNDIAGHQFGPDSPEEHAMVDGLDGDLDGFFQWVDKNVPGGLANVWIAFSADHGVAPTPAVSSNLGLPGVYINTSKLIANLNVAMNAKFSPGENVHYVIEHQSLPYLSLDQPDFERAGINEHEAEEAVNAAMRVAFLQLGPPPAAVGATANGVRRIPPSPTLFRSYTREQLATGALPPDTFGHILANSYSPNGGWYVMVIPEMYQMEGHGGVGTTHFTPYSYDRHVPLGFFGGPFTPGTYHGRVEPIDLAATWASLLGINQPSAAVGQVLTQAIHPLGVYPYTADVEAVALAKRRAAARRRHEKSATPETPAPADSTVPPTVPPSAAPATPTPAAPATSAPVPAPGSSAPATPAPITPAPATPAPAPAPTPAPPPTTAPPPVENPPR